MNLKKLKEQRAELIKQMNDMTAKAEIEERAFSDEDVTSFDDLEKQVAALDATIERVIKARSFEEAEPQSEQNTENNDNQESIEQVEERAFENHIRNIIVNRAEADTDGNLVAGAKGALIPTTIANKIITKVYDIAPILQRSTKYNIKGTLQIPFEKENSGYRMAYANEFDDLTSKNTSTDVIELTGYLAGTLSKISNSLINNSQFDIVNFVINSMAQDIARFLENELINGTTGKVDGLNKGITQKITTAAPTVITIDDIIKLKDKIKQAFQAQAVFVLNSSTLTALRLLKDANGRFLLQDDLTNDFGYSILGKPVYVSDNIEEIEAGKTVIYYGDLSGLATKFTEQMEIQVLRELFATQHATGVVAWVEFDAKVENAQALAKLEMAED